MINYNKKNEIQVLLSFKNDRIEKVTFLHSLSAYYYLSVFYKLLSETLTLIFQKIMLMVN